MNPVLPHGSIVNYRSAATAVDSKHEKSRMCSEERLIYQGSFPRPADAWFSVSGVCNWPGQCMAVGVSHHALLYFSVKG